MKEKVYKPYHQYITEMDKLDDSTFYALIQEIEKICCTRINIEDNIKKHNKKWASLGAEISTGAEIPNITSPKRLDMLIELCSLVNKVTKQMSKNNIKSGEITERIEESEDIDFTEEEIKKIKKWELSDKEKRYLEIIEGLKSKSEKDRKKAIKQYIDLSNDEFSEFKQLKDIVEDKEYFYKLKQVILTAIIYELRTHAEEYKDYQYGFIEDDTEKDDISCAFAISIPGHLGTYQFHIPRREERDIIYNINSIYEVNHKFAGLASGDRKIGQMNWLYTSDDIKDLEKIEEQYERIKARLSKTENIEDDDYRRLYMLAILLKKDPEKELMEINPEAARYYINSSESLTEDKGKKSRRLVEQYEGIINNIRTTGKIYVASTDSIDSKVAIESIIRQARKEGIDREIQIIKVNPGKQELSGGVYINVKKDGFQVDKKNQNGMIFINSNDSVREQSVCSVLSTLGFEIPQNIVKYASKVVPEICRNPNNVYLLLGRLRGKAIFDFCKEIEERGEDLIEILLTEDNIDSYTSISQEDKQKLLEESKRKAKKFEKIKSNIQYYNIGDKKVALCDKGISVGAYSMYIAFAEGADYYIGIGNDKNNGVRVGIQSNPAKCDLPLEVERWAYKKVLEEETIESLEDVLIEKRRIIIGGRTKPNISLKDRREDKSKSYIKEIVEEIIAEIASSEGKNIIDSLIEESLSQTSMKDIEEETLGIISTQEEKDKKGVEIGIE